MWPFKRKPVIYDLWADIRIYWALADYFEARDKAWCAMMQRMIQILSGPEAQPRDPKSVQFYRYEIK